MKRIIYVLINEHNYVHYVGKTKDSKSRTLAHKKTFINSTFEIIDEVPVEEWKFWERHYISLYRSWGFQLDNKKLYAGNGCDTVSDETRKKMSNARIGNPKAYKAFGNTYMLGKPGPMKGKTHSSESKEKMSELRKGKSPVNKGEKMSAEFCNKVSISKKGKKSSFKGKIQSDESKKKISLAGKGRVPWNKGKKIIK